MLKADSQIRNCANTGSKANPGFLGWLSKVGVAHAQYRCPDDGDNCRGSGWQDEDACCNTGGPCSGCYNTTTTGGPSCNGFSYDGSYCGDAPECGCESYECYYSNCD
jgi:hypothetical protein